MLQMLQLIATPAVGAREPLVSSAAADEGVEAGWSFTVSGWSSTV